MCSLRALGTRLLPGCRQPAFSSVALVQYRHRTLASAPGGTPCHGVAPTAQGVRSLLLHALTVDARACAHPRRMHCGMKGCLKGKATPIYIRPRQTLPHPTATHPITTQPTSQPTPTVPHPYATAACATPGNTCTQQLYSTNPASMAIATHGPIIIIVACGDAVIKTGAAGGRQALRCRVPHKDQAGQLRLPHAHVGIEPVTAAARRAYHGLGSRPLAAWQRRRTACMPAGGCLASGTVGTAAPNPQHCPPAAAAWLQRHCGLFA